MSYARRPYYIYGTARAIQFYDGEELLADVPYKPMKLFIASLASRPKQFFDFLKGGLAEMRRGHSEYKKEGLTEPGDKAMTKKELADYLEETLEMLRAEIRKAHR